MASIDNINNKLLVDSGSNLNLISKDYFTQLPGKYDTVGICRGRICEALGYNTITDSIVVKLYVTINNYSFSANFCIIVNTSNYFDLLIGMKTIADIYLYILFLSHYVVIILFLRLMSLHLYWKIRI